MTTKDEKPTITVREILDDYRKDFLFRGCRSLKSLKCEIGKVSEYLGELAAPDVTLPVLLEYQRKRRGDGLSAATVNKQLAVLRAAFRVAADNGRVQLIPPFPRRLRANKPRQGFFGSAEYEALRHALPPWGADILDFGYYSGWRKNEVLGLTWSEVDLASECIRLDPDRSKNYESRPALPLREWGLDAIRRRYAERDPGLQFVFHRGTGRRISSTHWWYVWDAARKASGFPHLLFHDLRRTVVRNLERGHVPRGVAMGWVGHRTEAVYQRYCITNENDLSEAASSFLGAVKGKKGPKTPDRRGEVVPFTK